MLNQEALWTCPICKAKHAAPAELCKRCGCNLSALICIRVKAYTLAMKGKVKESQALLSYEELKNLIIPLPAGTTLGTGFIMKTNDNSNV